MSSGTAGKGEMPDFQGLAMQQAQLNHPNVSTPYGTWSWGGPTYDQPIDYGGGSGGGGGSGSSGVGGVGGEAASRLGIGGAVRTGLDSYGREFNISDDLPQHEYQGEGTPPWQPTKFGANDIQGGIDGGGGGNNWPADGTVPSPAVPGRDRPRGIVADPLSYGDAGPERDTGIFTFSPEQQALYDAGVGISGDMLGAAQDRLDAGISGQNVEDALYGRLTSRLDPQWNQRADAYRTQLYNQGLREGDAGFDTAMSNFDRSRTDAYEQANYEAVLGGDRSALNQTNIINMLRSGNTPSVPGAPPNLGAGADVTGAANAEAAYNAQNNPLNLLAGLAPYLAMYSDARLKTNVRYLDAEALPGVRWAVWEWKAGGKGRGVIAQDVAKVRPDLVARGDDGFLRVDYSKIGA